MGVRRVVPDLSSTSLEAAKGFYGDLLGLRPVMDHGWIVTLADPERPGAQISLMTHDATAPVIPMSRFRWITWTPATRQRSRRALPFDPRAVGRSPHLSYRWLETGSSQT